MESISEAAVEPTANWEVEQSEKAIDFQAVHPGMFHPPGRKLEEGQVTILAAWYDPVVPRTPPPPEAINKIWV